MMGRVTPWITRRWRALWSGARLGAALERNRRAAAALDAAVKEMLEQ